MPIPRSRLSVQVWLGILLVLIGLAGFVGVHRWMASRTFVAVDMPLSLARGHVMTGPFKINLRDSYQVEIDTGWRSWSDPKCLPYDHVKAQWVLYRNGQVVAHWHESTPYTHLGGFDSEEGTYALDLEILSDTSCLDPGKPRLLVYTNKSNYEDYAAPTLWALALCVALGASLLALGCIASFEERHPRTARFTDSESIGQYFQWAQKLRLRKEFSALPAFALVAVPGLMILLWVFLILTPLPSMGLYVHLLKPGPLAVKDDLLSEPVVVQVIDAGPGVAPNVYVNSKPTSWDKLSGALKDELKLRPRWVVYVEANNYVPWADAVYAMDIAKGLHAKVVLLTSKPSPRTGHAHEGAESIQ